MSYRVILVSFIILLCLSDNYIQSQTELSDSLYKHYNYDQKYYEKSLLTQQPVGVVIVAYNRPYYLSQLIESIERNEESQSLPFFFILDGGPYATQVKNCEIINRSTIKNKEIILRERNFGCAKTIIDAKRFMFDWCKFKKVIFMEEDLIVSSFYFKLLLAFHTWAQQKYSNVGVVQCYSYCLLNETKKKQSLNLVQGGGKEWWSFVTYCIDNEVWDRVKPILYEYEERFVDTIPFTDDFLQERSRPALGAQVQEIRTWIRTLVKKKSENQRDEREVFIDNTVNLRNYFCNTPFEPNGDIIFGFALWLLGYVKMQTVVNRAKHVGKIGVTYDSKLYVKMKHNRIKLSNFQEDAFLNSFKVCSQLY